jgi:MtN3 and saliva related transmembrane protein
MSPTLITALGIVAAIGTTSSFVPQAWKTFRTRSADDFSWAYLGLFATGVTLWLVYGIFKKDIAIIGANGVTLLLLLVIMGVKWRA